MKSLSVRMIGALLCAAPLLSQLQLSFEPGVRNGKFVWFRLEESREEVARVVGPPSEIAGFGQDFVSWQYRLEHREDEEPSHSFVFRRSDGKLLSVTRNFASERDVSALFPAAETTVHEFHGERSEVYPVLVRKLDGSRLLLAM